MNRKTLRSSLRRRPACFAMVSSLGPTSCFYWASKLLRGTFWAPLKSFKSPAAPPKKGVGGTRALAQSILYGIRKNTRFRSPASSPTQVKSHATFLQPLQCVLQQHVHIHSARHHFPQSPSFVTTLRSSTCTFIQHVTTSLSHHFPQSPSFVTTLRSSTCTFIQHVTTSLSHH